MSDCCSNPPPDDKDRAALRKSLLKMGNGSVSPESFSIEPKPKPSACCGGSAEKSESSCCGGGKQRMDYLLWGSLLVFAVGIAVHWWVPGVPHALHVFGHACWTLTTKAWWGILFGIVSVAVIGRFPRELVAAIMGRSGTVSGLFRAVGAGVLLDLCNHGILMVGMGLYKRGTSLGQTIAFLIASPWNSISLTLILAALIGWKWMLLFILLSMVVAVITGWVVDRLVAAGKIQANPNAVELPHDYRVWPEVQGVLRSLMPGMGNYRRLMHEGLVGSKMVLRWIFFGFVLTAAIQAFVPEGIFQHFFGPTVMGLFLTLLATTLMEVCSEGSSPIAADLLTRANAPGNAFVFLMAGAATDYTEIMSLKETTKSWKASLALPLISTPQVLLIGWLIQQSVS